MPTYRLTCESCARVVVRTLVTTLKNLPADEREEITRCSCGKRLKRTPTPSTLVRESLDNGAMTHRVERLKDAEELYKDRAAKDPGKLT